MGRCVDMKKLLSVLLAGLLLLPFMCALAQSGLPFEVVPPTNISAQWLGGGDSPTTMSVSYTFANDMTEFYKARERALAEGRIDEFMAQYGIEDIMVAVQVDWAIDDVNDAVSGWHYTEYWDGNEFGYGYDSEGRYRCGAWDAVEAWIGNLTETSSTAWLLRGASEYDMNGDPENGVPGLKDQMRPEQYTLNEDGCPVIDFTEHTVYFRARLAVETWSEEAGNKRYYSDWTPACGYGRDAEAAGPLKPGDVAAPVITGLRMTDKEFNGNPVVAFTLTVPDELQAQLAAVSAKGGSIYVETEARVKGDEEWTLMQNADWTVKPGELESYLGSLVNDERPSIPKDTELELRCRYICTQPDEEEFASDWSNVITFDSDDIAVDPQPGAPETGDIGVPSAESCPICHFCSRPLGLCIFIWLAILVAILVVIFVIVRAAKKKSGK